MSLGVLNNISAIYAQTNLNQTQSSLQNTLTQLSSGSRINSGADDAAGLALADGLHANVAALTQSTQNATAGVGLLQTADGALSQVTNLLNRAVTLATEAANGTLNSSQVSSANQEYQNILSEIGNIGSTTNFNGNSVFSNTAKAVFVSDGTSSGATTFNEVVGKPSANPLYAHRRCDRNLCTRCSDQHHLWLVECQCGWRYCGDGDARCRHDTCGGSDPVECSGELQRCGACGQPGHRGECQQADHYRTAGHHYCWNERTYPDRDRSLRYDTSWSYRGGHGLHGCQRCHTVCRNCDFGVDQRDHCHRERRLPARYAWRQHQPVECGLERCQFGVRKPYLRRKQRPLDQLWPGDQRHGEVQGAEPDRYRRSVAGQQRAAGRSQAAPIRRGRVRGGRQLKVWPPRFCLSCSF